LGYKKCVFYQRYFISRIIKQTFLIADAKF
jgi:hypothetical protein